MGNSVNQEMLMSLNLILIEALKWVVEVVVKSLARKVFSTSRRSL